MPTPRTAFGDTAHDEAGAEGDLTYQDETRDQQMKRIAIGLSIAAALFLAIACSEDHDHEGEDHDHGEMPASCEAFHDACVKAESLGGLAAECHDLTHKEGLTESECAAKKNECTAACTLPAAPDAQAPDAGSRDAATGG